MLHNLSASFSGGAFQLLTSLLLIVGLHSVSAMLRKAITLARSFLFLQHFCAGNQSSAAALIRPRRLIAANVPRNIRSHVRSVACKFTLRLRTALSAFRRATCSHTTRAAVRGRSHE
jgi:hypothetical protein